MHTLSRRGALLGATAAVGVTAATAIPLAIKAAQVAATDPVIDLIDRSAELSTERARLVGMIRSPAEGGDDQLWKRANPLRKKGLDIACEVFRTPAATMDGLLAKARFAYGISAGSWGTAQPLGDTPTPVNEYVGALDERMLMWSILRDLERLAGEARS